MNRQSLVLVVAISALFAATSTAATVHHSQIRIRDPFVLPDPATKTYFIYNSTDWGSEAEQQRKSVIVYRSKDLVRLKDDLSAPIGKPATLFHATEAHWTRCRGDLGELFQGKRYHASITDGAWLHRTKTGKLIMLWSSYGPNKYATGIAVSTSGKVAGPWEQQQETLWLDDGGHPMLFETFDGRLVMTIHQPNRRVERARFFEMEDTGDTLRIKREITDFTAPPR